MSKENSYILLDTKIAEEDGVCKVTLTMKNNEDIREELSFAFADARLAVLTIKATEISLEDVYQYAAV